MRIRSWLISAAVLAACAAGADAAEVSPGFLRKELKAGKPDSFKLTFKTDKPREDVWIEPVDYSMDRKGQVSIAPLPNARYSGRAWCKMNSKHEAERIPLRRGAPKEVEIKIQVPSNTPGGEYYLGIKVFNPINQTTGQDGPFAVEYQVNFVVLVILDVTGGRPRVTGEVRDTAIQVNDSIPVVNGTFHNTGSVSVISRMGVIVRDGERKVYDKFILFAIGSEQPDGQAFVMPEAMRDYVGGGNRKLPSGKYTAEIFAIFGAKKHRVIKAVEFQVQGGQGVETPPLDDIQITPSNIVIEMPPGGVKYQVVELKNRGLNPVTIDLSGTKDVLSFFPESVPLEPGQVRKIRVSVRIPRTEDPRRDLAVTMKLQGGKEEDRRDFTLAIYAPGTAPKPEDNPLKTETPKEEDHEGHDHP